MAVAVGFASYLVRFSPRLLHRSLHAIPPYLNIQRRTLDGDEVQCETVVRSFVNPSSFEDDDRPGPVPRVMAVNPSLIWSRPMRADTSALSFSGAGPGGSVSLFG